MGEWGNEESFSDYTALYALMEVLLTFVAVAVVEGFRMIPVANLIKPLRS